MSKGEQLEALLNEGDRIHSAMEQLFIKNNLKAIELRALPKEDYEIWYALYDESKLLGKKVTDLILNKR